MLTKEDRRFIEKYQLNATKDMDGEGASEEWLKGQIERTKRQHFVKLAGAFFDEFVANESYDLSLKLFFVKLNTDLTTIESAKFILSTHQFVNVNFPKQEDGFKKVDRIKILLQQEWNNCKAKISSISADKCEIFCSDIAMKLKFDDKEFDKLSKSNVLLDRL
jgi:hypothetical protein